MKPLKAILFDLFGTVVQFSPRVPTLQVAGTQWRSTMGWLRPATDELLPAVPFESLLQALLATTEEIVRNRPPEYLEIPSPERFRRALAHLGMEGDGATDIARRLSLAHMEHLASTVMLPDGHLALLQSLKEQFRLALVSNFDHGMTARALLERHGVASSFESIVISDGFGRRKPHPAIFERALEDLGVSADEALFVGDSVADDVVGAHNAGIRAVWIDPKGEGTSTEPPPEFVVRSLLELSEIGADLA